MIDDKEKNPSVVPSQDPPAQDIPALQMENISKSFGSVPANKDVNFTLRKGEILALLGENGSGKTTLVNMLGGIYFPDQGSIYIDGREVHIRSPKDAFANKIGMIHQHFKLIDIFSAAENIVLGLDGGVFLNRKKMNKEVSALAERYGFDLDPKKKIYDMSVSEKQTVEILKVLYRGADILILDEPTAVLTPQETKKLFTVLRNMQSLGKSIIIITHKLHEVMQISDRVTILRKGEYIGTVETAQTDPDALTQMMVGKRINLEIDRPQTAEKNERLKLINVTCKNPDGVIVLHDISFSVMSGEILGIAGIAGSGQRELCEVIAGLYPAIGGSILYTEKYRDIDIREPLLGLSPDVISQKGVSMAFVPEDRLGMGLVASMDLTDNVMLRSYKEKKGLFVDRKSSGKMAQELMDSLEIAAPNISTRVSRLSGGNVQKVLLGREIACNPSVLIVAYPVRGLDIHSSYRIYDLLNEQKQKGVAVVFIGEDIDVLMEISDRLLVMCGGMVNGIVDPREVTKEEIGLMMIQTKERKPE